MNRTIAVALLALGGCSFNSGSVTTGDGGTSGDGQIDATPDAIPDAGPCTAASATCLADTLRTCAGAGADPVDRVCGWGCDMTNGRCAEVVPSANALVAGDLTSTFTDDVVLPAGTVIDTDAGTITGVSSPDTSVVGSIRVFRFKSLQITGDVSVVGANALAIAVDGAVEIGALIDMRGTCTNNEAGPGGFVGGSSKGGGSGPGGGAANSNNQYAGAGGGHGGMGGDGAGPSSGMTTTGGGTYGDDAITMLRGGSGGGGGTGAGAADGGGGGGALQIVSNTSIAITAGGINAGGCGGETKSGGNDGGGGGGAGGAILLEAPEISIAAASGLAVNGGGGGGGDGPSAMIVDGTDGKLALSPAAGGQGDVGGNGGQGAAGTMPDGDNGGFVSSAAGGGGGGGIGRIRINTRGEPGAKLTVDAAAILSPPISDSNTPTTCTVGSALLQ